MQGRRDEIATLLRKAQHDLIAGRALKDAGIPDIVCFHAQQAAEKALKALLASQGVAYPFQHNLQVLMALLADVPHPLERRRDDIEQLTEYATTERYEDIVRPDPAQVDVAVEVAQLVYETVYAIVLPDEHDPSEETDDEPES